MQEAARSLSRDEIPFHLSVVPTTHEAAGQLTLEPLKPEGAYDPDLQVWVMPNGRPRTGTEVFASSGTTSTGICGTNVDGIIISDRDQQRDD